MATSFYELEISLIRQHEGQRMESWSVHYGFWTLCLFEGEVRYNASERTEEQAIEIIRIWWQAHTGQQLSESEARTKLYEPAVP